MKVYEAIASTLREEKVDILFGVMGDGNLFFVDHYINKLEGRYVPAASEGAAISMANGYACRTGSLGFATVTHGPGVTNCITPLVEGVRNHTPMVIIMGDTAADDPEHLQNIEQRALILSTGAAFIQVNTASTVVTDLRHAINQALAELRPVCVNIPIDLQWVETSYRERTREPVKVPLLRPDAQGVENATAIIAQANRPMILAGRGACTPQARESILKLADHIGAPVATTLKARDLFRDTPFDLGVFGTLSTSTTLSSIGRSDCLIVFGAGLNKYTTDDGSLTKDKAIVYCDPDIRQVSRQPNLTAGLVGDIAVSAAEIVRLLTAAATPRTRFRDGLGVGGAIIDTESERTRPSRAGTVDLRKALLALDQPLPRSRTLVTDLGRFFRPTMKTLSVSDPFAYVNTASFGAIGLGLANANGAAFGAPTEPVLHISGDGGFMLGGIGEFNTAVRNDLDLVVVVLNDGAYGAEHIQFRQRGMAATSSLFDWPDLAAVAKSLGGEGITVRNDSDLATAGLAIQHRSKPLLVDVRIDPEWI